MNGSSYVSHKNKLVVLWAPKCACTAAGDWFFSIEGLDDVKFKRKWLIENGYLYNYIQAKHLVENHNYKSVQFTRNPYSRTISAYLNKFYIYQKRPLTELHMLEPFSRDLILFYNNQYKLKKNKYRGISFVEYLLILKKLMREYDMIDHHWDSQLPRNIQHKMVPDFIVRQENFIEDLKNVNRTLHYKGYIPPDINKTYFPENFKKSDRDESESNNLSLIRRKISLTKENLLNDYTKSIIYELYRNDFIFFGYPKEISLHHYPQKSGSRNSWLARLFLRR